MSSVIEGNRRVAFDLYLMYPYYFNATCMKNTTPVIV
jgi:hypothetical protein